MDEEAFESEGAVAAWLVDAMTSTFESRTIAERLLDDVRRNRYGEPLPLHVAAVRRLLWHELAPSASGIVGVSASALAVELELLLDARVELPAARETSCMRVVSTARARATADAVGALLGASDVCWAPELWQLLIALESDERTILVHDLAESDLDAGLFARLVPDFAPNVVTFVASVTPAARAVFLETGAAFRATLGPEPIGDPAAAALLAEVARSTMRAPMSASEREERTTMPQLRAG